MGNEKYITSEILEKLKVLQDSKPSKIRERVIYCLESQFFSILANDHKIFWLEHNPVYRVSDAVFKHLYSFMKKQGYTSIRDLGR